MLKHADYIGYHPYRSTVADLKLRISQVKKIVGNKPLIATEWNIRGREGNNSNWAKGIKDFYPIIRDNFHGSYFFAAVKNNSMAGKSGLLTNTGSKISVFYDTWKGLKSGTFAR